MILTQTIENLTTWVQENICSQVTMLKPDDKQMDEGYEVEYVNPKAFPLYIPAKDCLPPDVDTKLPAVCVQLIDGNDNLTKYEETLHIRIAFAVWRPGTYTEVEEQDENGNVAKKQKFVMNADGWKDVWSFLDKAKRIIQKNMYIEDVRIDRKEPMKFGFFSNDDTMVNAYPEWYAWLSFAVKSGTAVTPEEKYQELL